MIYGRDKARSCENQVFHTPEQVDASARARARNAWGVRAVPQERAGIRPSTRWTSLSPSSVTSIRVVTRSVGPVRMDGGIALERRRISVSVSAKRSRNLWNWDGRHANLKYNVFLLKPGAKLIKIVNKGMEKVI